ncbi:uncharacterized protein [Heliangelus exortis]|uniref:uncharacterized protein isoform X3 n=1 Tax=Heliangelus exortis TaxID=472823 RepID=UPI003A90209F
MEPVPTIPPLPPPAMPTLATPPSLGGSKPSRAGNRGGPGVQITPSSVQPEDMSLVLSSGIWFEEPVECSDGRKDKHGKMDGVLWFRLIAEFSELRMSPLSVFWEALCWSQPPPLSTGHWFHDYRHGCPKEPTEHGLCYLWQLPGTEEPKAKLILQSILPAVGISCPWACQKKPQCWDRAGGEQGPSCGIFPRRDG